VSSPARAFSTKWYKTASKRELRPLFTSHHLTGIQRAVWMFFKSETIPYSLYHLTVAYHPTVLYPLQEETIQSFQINYLRLDPPHTRLSKSMGLLGYSMGPYQYVLLALTIWPCVIQAYFPACTGRSNTMLLVAFTQKTTYVAPISSNFALYMSKESEQDNQDDTGSPIEQEIERLQDQLAPIEALEARNEAQIESFIDQQDQWNSLEEEERQLLQSKDAILQRMEVLSEELIQMWMGQKSMDG
jgi:hypothetical protein